MSFLSRFSPVSSFPPLPGPYSVGTIDIEIATSDLDLPIEPPEGAQPTIQYRLFYPCQAPPKHHPKHHASWIPNPQKENLSTLLQYGNLSPRLASIISHIPTPITHIVLPATPCAPPCFPYDSDDGDDDTARPLLPLTIFSHGLAGTRNLYSHLCCSLASYGQLVLAPTHRDGSAPIAHVRATETTPAVTVPTIRVPYSGGKEVDEARDRQLRIRCWEVGTAWASVVQLVEGRGRGWKNLAGEGGEVLEGFRGKVDLRDGQTTWAGHSFGGATAVAFSKSVFWKLSDMVRVREDGGEGTAMGERLRSQINGRTRLVLFDPWMSPLAAATQRTLKAKPLPCFDLDDGVGGKAVLAIVSEGFWKWKANLDEVVALLRPPPPPPPPSATKSSKKKKGEQEEGRAWYAVGSKHFSQSDFGVLFSWVLERWAGAANGRELLEGNVKLVNEMMRANGVPLASDGGVPGEERVASGQLGTHGSSHGSPVADGNGDEKGTAEQQSQVVKPVTEAMPSLLDEKVWIKIPID